MKKILLVFIFIALGFNLFLASWYVANNDIYFSTEIARDFFLLDELDQKKIVLIGPSSSTGLFHGPLWTYINYPAYLLGHGNPVIVGWGWVFFIIVFLTSSFFITKKLFDLNTAYLFVLMNSLYMVFHAKWLYNPYGAMFLMPAFFFFFVKYIQTFKLRYLIIHTLITGAIIQFQMAVGIPLFILSFLCLIFMMFKKNRKKHVFIFLIIFLTLANFLIFDLRHNFLISNLVLHYILSPGRDNPDYFLLLQERLRLMVSSVEILRLNEGYRNIILFFTLLFFIFLQIKDGKYKTIYISFLYFYIGFFFLSLFNTGHLLYFYLFPLFPLVFLIFSSFITSRFKLIFVFIFVFIYISNTQTAISDIKYANTFIGKDIYSWNFLYNVAAKVYQFPEKEFGYFVYSPNVVAYEGKYAMFYARKVYKKNPHYFEKKPATFLVIAPPPPDNPYMEDKWWRINQVKISKKPDEVFKFENGYKIERYKLTNEEIKVPYDKAIDPGLHFR